MVKLNWELMIMNFDNIRIKNVDCVLDFTPSISKWESKNRITHIIGGQISGNAMHDLEYKEIALKENCIFFLNQKDNFSVNMREIGKSYSIHFTTYEDISTDSFSVQIKDITPIINTIAKIDHLKSISSDNDLLLMNNMYKLCFDFSQILGKKYSKIDQRILKAKQYLDEHIDDPSCLSNASNTADMSRRRFNDLFKQTYGITPNKYLVSKKVELAKNLLKIAYLSITDIASMSGYENIYYFSRVFKESTGMSPTEYRKATLNL